MSIYDIKIAISAVELMSDVARKNKENVVLSPDGGFFAENCDKTIIKELNKRLPKKPTIKPDKLSPNLITHYYCPTCGMYYGQRGIGDCIIFKQDRYCQGQNCGQAIDWSEENE